MDNPFNLVWSKGHLVNKEPSTYIEELAIYKGYQGKYSLPTPSWRRLEALGKVTRIEAQTTKRGETMSCPHTWKKMAITAAMRTGML